MQFLLQCLVFVQYNANLLKFTLIILSN